MRAFPEIKQDQVVLLRADKKTGHVLDEQLSLAVDATQKVFTVFDSLTEAMAFGERLLSTNHEVEIVIYSNKENILFYSNE